MPHLLAGVEVHSSRLDRDMEGAMLALDRREGDARVEEEKTADLDGESETKLAANAVS